MSTRTSSRTAFTNLKRHVRVEIGADDVMGGVVSFRLLISYFSSFQMLTEESMSVTEEEPDKVVEDHMTSRSPQLLTELPSQTASTSTSSLGILVSSWPCLRSK
ncbi:hypothetical protein XENOCAPTIV_017953, partial [Xenoophorus captivus]